jgi:hypothetical protein
MRDIYRPFVAGDDPDRELRCQDAMQFAFQDFVTASTAAGWSELESIQAILCLAQDRMQMLAANDDARSLCDMLREMVQTTAA